MTDQNNPGSFGSARGLSQKIKKDKKRKSSSTRWIGRQLNDPYVLETQKGATDLEQHLNCCKLTKSISF